MIHIGISDESKGEGLLGLWNQNVWYIIFSWLLFISYITVRHLFHKRTIWLAQIQPTLLTRLWKRISRPTWRFHGFFTSAMKCQPAVRTYPTCSRKGHVIMERRGKPSAVTAVSSRPSDNEVPETVWHFVCFVAAEGDGNCHRLEWLAFFALHRLQACRVHKQTCYSWVRRVKVLAIRWLL